MLDRALAYKTIVNEVCKDRQLRQYEIEKTEWDALENLRDLLKVRTVYSGRVCVGVLYRHMVEAAGHRRASSACPQ